MKFQIIDKDYGPQLIPGLNSDIVEADNAEDAISKVMKLLKIPQEYSDKMEIEAVATTTAGGTESYYCPDYPDDELIKPCDCDKCYGACNNGNGGKCGQCFACEEIADDKKFWQVNREDILGI